MTLFPGKIGKDPLQRRSELGPPEGVFCFRVLQGVRQGKRISVIVRQWCIQTNRTPEWVLLLLLGPDPGGPRELLFQFNYKPSRKLRAPPSVIAVHCRP